MKLTNEEKIEIRRLTDLSYSAKMIANILHRGTSTIERFWKREGLKSKYREQSDFLEKNKNEIRGDILQGYTDVQLSLKYKCSVNGIYKFRLRHTILQNKMTTELDDYQKEFLVGTLLGDSSLILVRTSAYYMCQHSDKQYDYIKSKYQILKSLFPHLYKRDFHKKRKDGTDMISWSLTTKSFKCLKEYYDYFYPNGVKQIPFSLLYSTFTVVSLAFLFMDDGNYYNNSIGLSLCSFTEDELDSFILFLEEKFRLHFYKCFHYNKYYKKDYIELRLKPSDFEQFKALISPYIQEWAKYKLGGS